MMRREKSDIFNESEITVEEWNEMFHDGLRKAKAMPFYCTSCVNLECRKAKVEDAYSHEDALEEWELMDEEDRENQVEPVLPTSTKKTINYGWCNFMDMEVEPTYEALDVCRYYPKKGIRGVSWLYRLKVRYQEFQDRRAFRRLKA